MNSRIILYDGTFDGFLSAVFEIYEYKINDPIIKRLNDFQDELFNEYHTVTTNLKHAKRVWQGLKKCIQTKGCNLLFFCFLSEENGIENTMFNVIRHSFNNKQNILSDYSNPHVLNLSKTAKKVRREKHRLEAFVRFKHTKDNLYFSTIEPDFNVLPLIKNHFTKRYADQKWIIYDLKRKYGLFFNLQKTEIIAIDLDFSISKKDRFTLDEEAYESLWKDYFKSTNIEERVNMALHTKHVPKRYWKYLSEKQP